MFLLTIYLVCLFAALGAGILASVSDFRGLTIPNSFSLIVAAAFFAAYVSLALLDHAVPFSSVASHLTSGAIIFAITAAMFAAKAIGAADSKLLTAYSFWAGIKGIPALLFYTTLIGGLLGLVALGLRKWKPFKNPRPGGWIARSQAGENKVPYGIAIALGALASFIKLGYFNSETLSSFLLS